MFGCNSPQRFHRRRRGVAALLAGVLAVAGLGVAGPARPANAASICDVAPERCVHLPTFTNDPYGALDAPSFSTGAVRVTGWASDRNVNGPIDVIVTVDGAASPATAASLYRAGVGNLGFDITVPASPTSMQVCVTGVNVGSGQDASIGCAPFPYSTNVSPTDPCGVETLPLGASLSALSPPNGQALVEMTSSLGGRIGFMTGPSVPGTLVGLSLSDAVLPGPLFRSGPMSALPAGSPGNPSGKLNVIVPCPTRLTAAQVIAMASGLSVTPPPGVTITSKLLVPGNGTMTLTLTGTFTGSLSLGFVTIPYTEPFTYTLTFTVSPSTNVNDPAEIVLVTPTGPGTLVFTGGLGPFLNLGVAQVLEPGVRMSVATAVQNGLNSLIASNAAARFPGGLPAGATISMARIVITPSGASLTVAVGWFG